MNPTITGSKGNGIDGWEALPTRFQQLNWSKF
jgi:hypothetical protein